MSSFSLLVGNKQQQSTPFLWIPKPSKGLLLRESERKHKKRLSQSVSVHQSFPFFLQETLTASFCGDNRRNFSCRSFLRSNRLNLKTTTVFRNILKVFKQQDLNGTLVFGYLNHLCMFCLISRVKPLVQSNKTLFMCFTGTRMNRRCCF